MNWRMCRRRGLPVLALLLVFGVGMAWWYQRGRTPLDVPDIEGSGIDPEVADTIQIARQAVLRAPGSANAWGRLGMIYHVHRFLSEALVCYAEAEKLDHRKPDWPYLRGILLLTGAEPDSALPDLRAAAEHAADNPMPHLSLGEVLLERGQIEEAAGQFQQALAISPHHPLAYLRLAQVAASRQEWSECLRYLDVVADAPSARKLSCSLRVLAHQRLGQNEAAEQARQHLAHLPDDPPWPDAILDQLAPLQMGVRPRVIRGMQMLRAGDQQAALSLLQDTVDLYPDSDVAWAGLGRSLGILQRYPEAENALRQSVKLAPDTADVWSSLGLVCLRQEKHAEALKCYRTVVRLKPSDAVAHTRIGDCLVATGNRTAAVAAYREALRYQPDSPEVKERLAQLHLANPR